MPEVKPGQIWQDNDKRNPTRQVKVVELFTFKKRTGRPGSRLEDVPMASCVSRPAPNGEFSKRRVGIQISRFRPNSTGYTLVAESEAEL